MIEKNDYKILVISDTHGDYRRINEVIKKEYPFDVMIHCGDAQLELDMVLDRRNDYELYAVKGNCDSYSNLPYVITPRICGTRFYITHGHRLDVDYSLNPIIREGLREAAGVVLFGHSHLPMIRHLQEENMLLLNPGSLKLPRQYPRVPTYALIKLKKGEKPEAKIIKCSFPEFSFA